MASAFSGKHFRVVANLPYYITTDVVLRLLRAGLPLTDICVMVQKEAAERIMAHPGEKQWCATAAEVQYFGKPELLLEVPPENFDPPPHVMSCLMRIRLYDEKPVRPQNEVFLGIAAGATGIMGRFLMTGAGSVYLSVKDMITSPVSCIIILAVGYDLQLDREMLKECIRPVLMRMAVMSVMLCALLLLMRGVFSQREMRIALMLYLFMPPTYVVSAYTKERDDAAFVSTATSLYTLISIGVFVLLNIAFAG